MKEVDPWVIIEKLRDQHKVEIHDVWMPLVAQHRENCERLQSRLEELNQKVEELEKENASLKQDAARYRALRDSDEVFIRYSDGVDIHFVESTDQLDRLADAAMQANSQ